MKIIITDNFLLYGLSNNEYWSIGMNYGTIMFNRNSFVL